VTVEVRLSRTSRLRESPSLKTKSIDNERSQVTTEIHTYEIKLQPLE